MAPVPANAAIVRRAAGFAIQIIPGVRQGDGLPRRVVEIRQGRIGDILADELPLFIEINVQARRSQCRTCHRCALHDDEQEEALEFLFIHGRNSVRGTRTLSREILPLRMKTETLSAAPSMLPSTVSRVPSARSTRMLAASAN